MKKRYDVFGLGNTLLDFMIRVEESDLVRMDLKKGVFNLLEEGRTHSLLEEFRDHKIIPAGTVPNTLMGIAALGGRCILCGKVGPGKYGRHFEEVITREGVTPRLLKSENSRTGKVLNFVTPDAERTFGVSLGASSRVHEDSVVEDDIADSRVFYFTGYEFESINAAVMRTIRLAKKHETLVVMDLADPEIVRRNMGGILDVMKHVDMVFMNEDEAKRFTGLGPEDAAKEVGGYVPTVVVKAGPEGSFVVSGDELYRISPIKAKAVDSTGAGDLYAAGFLYSYLRDGDVRKAGNMGSFMGAKAVSQLGALMSDDLKKEAREMFENSK